MHPALRTLPNPFKSGPISHTPKQRIARVVNELMDDPKGQKFVADWADLVNRVWNISTGDLDRIDARCALAPPAPLPSRSIRVSRTLS